jgi:hypothetical protein
MAVDRPAGHVTGTGLAAWGQAHGDVWLAFSVFWQLDVRVERQEVVRVPARFPGAPKGLI